MKFNITFNTVAFSEFCNRLSFYGLQALLVLYLLHDFDVLIDTSYAIYGNYIALAFASCIIGGIIADKFISKLQAVFLGVTFMLIGNSILVLVSTLEMVYIGISFVVLGVGFIKPGTACLIDLLYKQAAEQKSKAFVYYYMIGSAGAIVGPFIYGFGIIYQKYMIGFIFGTFVMVANLLFVIVSSRKLVDFDESNKTHYFSALAAILISITAIYLVLSDAISIIWLIAPVLLFSLVFLYQLITTLETKQQHVLYSLSVPILVSLIFFTLLLQVFSSVTVFIYKNVNTTFWGFEIPITWFGAAESFFILAMAPVVVNLWQKLANKNILINSYRKLMIGLAITSVAFLIFALSAKLNIIQNSFVVLFILFALLNLAIAELCIIPVSIAIITTHTPPNYKAMFMGGYYFILASAGYFAGLLAQFSPDESSTDPAGFIYFFLFIAISIIVIIIFLHFFASLLKIKSQF